MSTSGATGDSNEPDYGSSSVRDYLEPLTPTPCSDDQDVSTAMSPLHRRSILTEFAEVARPGVEALAVFHDELTTTKTTLALRSPVLDQVDQDVPGVYVSVRHLLETLPSNCLGTFQAIWFERSWWSHVPPYRSAVPHVLVANICKHLPYVYWTRLTSCSKLFCDYRNTMTRWARSASRSAMRNEDHGPQLQADPLCCPCAECWQEHYVCIDNRSSHTGWHPLRLFWLGMHEEHQSEETEEEDDPMGSSDPAVQLKKWQKELMTETYPLQ